MELGWQTWLGLRNRVPHFVQNRAAKIPGLWRGIEKASLLGRLHKRSGAET